MTQTSAIEKLENMTLKLSNLYRSIRYRTTFGHKLWEKIGDQEIGRSELVETIKDIGGIKSNAYANLLVIKGMHLGFPQKTMNPDGTLYLFELGTTVFKKTDTGTYKVMTYMGLD